MCAIYTVNPPPSDSGCIGQLSLSWWILFWFVLCGVGMYICTVNPKKVAVLFASNTIALLLVRFSPIIPEPTTTSTKKNVPTVSETSFNFTYWTHELELGYWLVSIYSRYYDLIIKFCIYLLSDIMLCLWVLFYYLSYVKAQTYTYSL